MIIQWNDMMNVVWWMDQRRKEWKKGDWVGCHYLTSRQRCGLDCTGSSWDRIVCIKMCLGAESLRLGEKQRVEIKDFSLSCWGDGSAIYWTGKGWGECRFGENFGFRDICLVWLLDTHVEMSDRQLNVKSQAYEWYLWVNSKRRKHACI